MIRRIWHYITGNATAGQVNLCITILSARPTDEEVRASQRGTGT